MAEYKGNNVVVEFTTDISATLTRVEINEEAANRKKLTSPTPAMLHPNRWKVSLVSPRSE